MKGSQHLISSMIFVAILISTNFLSPWSTNPTWMFYERILLVFLAFYPDIDLHLKMKHRNIFTHCSLPFLALSLVFGGVFWWTALGIVSLHLLLDMKVRGKKMGFYTIAHPMGRLNVRKTDAWLLGNGCLAALSVVMMLYI